MKDNKNHIDLDVFKCPLCGAETHFSQSEIYKVETSRVPVRSYSFGGTTATRYECHFHNIRVCKKCAHIQSTIEKIVIILWFVAFIVGAIVSGFNFFNSNSFSLGIWNAIVEIIGFLVLCLGIFILSGTIFGLLLLIIGVFHKSPHSVSYEKASRCNAIAPMSKEDRKTEKCNNKKKWFDLFK